MSEEDLQPVVSPLPPSASFHKTKAQKEIEKANARWVKKKERKYAPGYKQRNLDWLPTYKRPSRNDNSEE
jgi:hypothetical protein